MFMPSYKSESAVLLRNNVTLSLESVDLKMAPVCSHYENQQWLKTVVQRGPSGAVSRSTCSEGKSVPSKSY